LVRWADNYRTGQLGGPRLLEALTAGAVPDERVPGAQYGGGLHITPDGAIGHGGHWAGNISFLTISPDRRTAVAGSCNAEDGIDFEKVLPGIQGIWFG
jgi:CubicO group peptidase (beta-lactamase class C family)